MKTATLHDGVLDRKKFGIRAQRLSQAAVTGAPVPPAIVISDAARASEDFELVREKLTAHLESGKLYTLRASPGSQDWGGPYTFLALGMNDGIFKKMVKDGRGLTACELYRQAVVTGAISVHNLDAEPFEALVTQLGQYDPNGSFDRAQELLSATKELYKAEIGTEFPQNAIEQLEGAIKSMARQWQSPTAKILRQAKGAPTDAHLALVLQDMVHGLGTKNGVGRIQEFNSKTGLPELNGIFVQDTLSAAGANPNRHWQITKTKSAPSLEQFSSKALSQIKAQIQPISKTIKDAVELKFVIDSGKIWVTEVLIAERDAIASIPLLSHLVREKILTSNEAILRLDPASIATFLHPQIDPQAPRDVLAQGVAASPGAATGAIVFHSEAALQAHAQGKDVILVRHETSPDDIRGMHAARAVLTIRGGMTSHAAVIARGIGVPCVVGAQSLRVNLEEGTLLTQDGYEIHEGEIITIDGSHGQVLRGMPKMVDAMIEGYIDQVLKWANAARRMQVRANADTPDDARRAMRFGVDGIGLCRTEHMFFAEDRLKHMRRMILAETSDDRRDSLSELEPDQTADFIELFEIMQGLPVTIRLLDPPLHEFFPKDADDVHLLAKSLEVDETHLSRRIKALSEFNPMLGLRGVRVGIAMPEIYEMQARAIFAAAAHVNQSAKKPIVPEIMIPLVSANREVEIVKARIKAIAEEIGQETKAEIHYRLGVMVETPRGALRAGDLAKTAEFLSMGTNDLTQMTYGLSRDDAGRFMREYVNNGVFKEDPFLTLDLEGVGELLHEAVKRGREANPNLLIGLCGEHGGDPASIHFCETEKFDYVSCSAYRVPIAQIAAAQSAIMLNSKG